MFYCFTTRSVFSFKLVFSLAILPRNKEKKRGRINESVAVIGIGKKKR